MRPEYAGKKFAAVRQAGSRHFFIGLVLYTKTAVLSRRY